LTYLAGFFVNILLRNSTSEEGIKETNLSRGDGA